MLPVTRFPLLTLQSPNPPIWEFIVETIIGDLAVQNGNQKRQKDGELRN